MTSDLQFQLLNDIGRTLVNRGTLSAVLPHLQKQFSETFPEARGALFLSSNGSNGYLREMTFRDNWPDSIQAFLENAHRQAAKERESITIDGYGSENAALAGCRIHIYPITADNKVAGFFDIIYPADYPLNSSTTGAIQLLVQQLGIAIGNEKRANDHLTGQGMDQVQTAEALQLAAVALSSSLDLNIVLDELLMTLANVIPCNAISIMLFNDDQIDFTAYKGFSDEAVQVNQANQTLQDSEILTEIIETRSPIYIGDVRKDTRWIIVPGFEKIRSWLGAPLRSGQDVLGVLMVDRDQPDAFLEREIALITTLASHAAIAVQNARLHHEVQSQVAELGKLYEATTEMMSNLDQASLFQSVVQEMVAALQVEEGAVFTWDDVNEHLEFSAGFPPFAIGSAVPSSEFERDMMGLRELERYPAVQRAFENKSILALQAGSNEAETAELAKAANLQSALLVPLIWRQEILGCLILGNYKRQHNFSSQELRMTRTLARQAAIAIEHTDLFNQARRRIQELSTIHEIALKLNTPLETNQVLDIINYSALELIEANNVHIFLYDDKKDQFTIGSALFRDGRRTPAVSSPRKDGITAEIVNSGKRVIIADALGHRLYSTPESAAWGVRAIAGFPMRRGNRILGAFTLTYLHRHNFTDDEILLLSLLADQAAVAVENARLFTEAQRRLRDMSALVDMAQQVTGNLRLERVMVTTVKILQGLLGARGCSIALLDEESNELVIEAATGIDPKWVHKARMKVGEGISGQAVLERRPIYVRDTYKHPDFLFFDEVLRSLIAVPLVSRDKVIGALSVDSDSPRAFEDSDIQLMTIAAAQVSSAIENARLYEEVEDRAAQLAIAYEELQDSDRLKDELVQNVSHELRTPLTFVKGYVDLLMDGGMGLVNEDQQGTLKIVSDKTQEITRLVDDIMSLQRISSENLVVETFEMRKLIEEAISGHRLTADRKGLTLLFEPNEKQPGKVVADRGRIQQVVDNLLVNAIKFSFEEGTIELSMEELPDEVIVKIKDQGIGLPVEKAGRIFERFYQVDGTSRRRFGGAGIGLAIVKRIIDAHMGNIWVESEINKGSTFYFSIPKLQVPKQAV